MSYQLSPLIDDAELATARREIGASLPRILGYYRHDGAVSITAIEDAMEKRDAIAMVLPAHSLKGESLQLGARQVGDLAQHIEMTARRCLEARTELPDDLVADVARVRGCFHETIAMLEAAVGVAADPAPVAPPSAGPASIPAPAVERPRFAPLPRPVFGRRVTS